MTSSPVDELEYEMTDNGEKVGELLTWLMDTVKTTESFALEHAPDVAREMVTFGRISSWSAVAAGVVLILAVVITVLIVGSRIAKGMRDKQERPFMWASLSVSSLLPIGLCAVMIGHNISDALMSTFAPKLYILHEVSEMIR